MWAGREGKTTRGISLGRRAPNKKQSLAVINRPWFPSDRQSNAQYPHSGNNQGGSVSLFHNHQFDHNLKPQHHKINHKGLCWSHKGWLRRRETNTVLKTAKAALEFTSVGAKSASCSSYFHSPMLPSVVQLTESLRTAGELFTSGSWACYTAI